MSWIKKLFKKELKDYWEYQCINRHIWKEKEGPRSLCSINGVTRCPICKSTICIGNEYINGKLTGCGVVHIEFTQTKKRKKK